MDRWYSFSSQFAQCDRTIIDTAEDDHSRKHTRGLISKKSGLLEMFLWFEIFWKQPWGFQKAALLALLRSYLAFLDKNQTSDEAGCKRIWLAITPQNMHKSRDFFALETACGLNFH